MPSDLITVEKYVHIAKLFKETVKMLNQSSLNMSFVQYRKTEITFDFRGSFLFVVGPEFEKSLIFFNVCRAVYYIKGNNL